MQQLNPNACIVPALFGKVDLANILHTGLFNLEEAEQGRGWQEELKKAHHTPETEEYGTGSFVFRDSRPFHPQRSWDYISDGWPGEVIRSKGLFWLASRPSDALNLGQAGGSLRAENAGAWWASIERLELNPTFRENRDIIMARWDKRSQGRQNELVFVGQDVPEARVRQELEACLCTEAEIHHWQRGSSFQDP